MFNKHFYSVFTNEDTSNLGSYLPLIQSVNFTPEDVYYPILTPVKHLALIISLQNELLKLSAELNLFNISNIQFGFHVDDSTVTLQLSAVHDWSSSQHQYTHCVFSNFAKAFDSVYLMSIFLLNFIV